MYDQFSPQIQPLIEQLVVAKERLLIRGFTTVTFPISNYRANFVINILLNRETPEDLKAKLAGHIKKSYSHSTVFERVQHEIIVFFQIPLTLTNPGREIL